jgi:hypothetical protein
MDLVDFIYYVCAIIMKTTANNTFLFPQGIKSKRNIMTVAPEGSTMYCCC